MSVGAPGRYALIIAVSSYDDPKLQKLRSPAVDAERLASVLRDSAIGGFEVDVALDDDEREIRRRIARFFSDRRPDDLLLAHFSCHGVKDEDGELYLAARDTEIGNMLGATGISSAWLRDQIDRSRSKRIVLLLDCCYSGSVPFGMRSRAGDEVDVRGQLQGRGRAVITASSATEYSYEGDDLTGAGQPSIFTAAVVEGLETGRADRDGDRMISVDDLYDYVYEHVRDRTPNQNPTKISSLEGPLHIARSVYEPPVVPAELDPALIDLMRHVLASGRLSAVEELAALLGSDDRAVVAAARQGLESMRGDDSRRVAVRVEEVLDGSSVAATDEPEPATDQPEPDSHAGADQPDQAPESKQAPAADPSRPSIPPAWLAWTAALFSFGLAAWAVMYTNQAKTKLGQGDLTGASRAGKIAYGWILATVVLWIVGIAISGTNSSG